MPNWCFNRLTIDPTTQGGKVLAEAFKPKYKYEDSDLLYAKPFSDLMPCPDDLQIEAGFFGDTEKNEEMQKLYEANKAKYGHAHWYDWQIDKWGTKWDARVEDYVDDDPNEIYVYFDTAWSPPVEFFKWFSEQYPDAIYMDEYDEEGMSFEGRVGVEKTVEGNEFIDECWDIEEEENA